VSNAWEMMENGRRWMMERWNELILAPAALIIIEMHCTSDQFDGEGGTKPE
jgi:hypothetical protein